LLAYICLVKILNDYKNDPVRLTDERISHIEKHAELQGMEDQIEEALKEPDLVIRGHDVNLNYRYYNTRVGNKWLCVVVKYSVDDAFVLTAYLTNRVKKGEILWKNT